MKKEPTTETGKEFTPVKLTAKDKEQIKASYLGHLDGYFDAMMTISHINQEEREVYEVAVQAFINDISHNGLPTIRRDRYNREFEISLAVTGLTETYQRMIPFPKVKVKKDGAP
jgi:hypothetical protein